MRFVLCPHLYPQSFWVEMRDHIGNGKALLGLLSGVPGTSHGTLDDPPPEKHTRNARATLYRGRFAYASMSVKE